MRIVVTLSEIQDIVPIKFNDLIYYKFHRRTHKVNCFISRTLVLLLLMNCRNFLLDSMHLIHNKICLDKVKRSFIYLRMHQFKISNIAVKQGNCYRNEDLVSKEIMVPLGSNIHSYESGCHDSELQICDSRRGRLTLSYWTTTQYLAFFRETKNNLLQ